MARYLLQNQEDDYHVTPAVILYKNSLNSADTEQADPKQGAEPSGAGRESTGAHRLIIFLTSLTEEEKNSGALSYLA